MKVLWENKRFMLFILATDVHYSSNICSVIFFCTYFHTWTMFSLIL